VLEAAQIAALPICTGVAGIDHRFESQHLDIKSLDS